MVSRTPRSVATSITVSLLVAALETGASAQICKLDVLEDFQGLSGISPEAGVIQAGDGRLYVATSLGGKYGWGTVFTVKTDGSDDQVVHDFDASAGDQVNDLIQASDGMLYGTTMTGGAFNDGMVFRLDTDGSNYADILDFDGATTGAEPRSGALLEGSDGALYGTTSSYGGFGWGTLYKVAPDGSGFTDLRDFDRYNGGYFPVGTLNEATTDGLIYGVAHSGGVHDAGTLFSVALDGSGFQVVHAFDGSTGNIPSAGVTQAPGLATLYGVTTQGGASSGGTLDSVDTDGSSYQDLHSFEAGSQPLASVVFAADGTTIFGTTRTGGSGRGSLFTWFHGSSCLTLADFDWATGANPTRVVLGSDGNLYGTTTYGGPYNWNGILFSFPVIHATATNYGAGLAGTDGVPGLSLDGSKPFDTPVIGQMFTFDIGNSLGSATNAVLVLGYGQTSRPLWGGTLLVNISFVFGLAVPPTGLSIDAAAPVDPCLLGDEVDLQVLEFDPGAPRLVSFSQGLQLLVGME